MLQYRISLTSWIAVIVLGSVLLLSASAARADLMCYWQFDDLVAGTPKTTTESAGYTGGPYTGNVSDNYVTLDSTNAKFGNSLSFDGLGDLILGGYVTGSGTSGLNKNNVTISAWARPTATAENYSCIAGKDGAWALQHRGLDANDPFIFYATVGGVHHSAQYNNPSLNTWYHLVASYDGETAKLYVNGASPISNTNPSGNLDTSTNDIYISRDATANPGGNFNGQIDDLGVWDAALTDGEAKAIYSLGIDSELTYKMGLADELFEAHGDSSDVTLSNSDQWDYETGLDSIKGSAVPGELFTSGGDRYLLLTTGGGDSGTGMMLIPEPGTVVLLLSGILGLIALRLFRRRR